MAIPKVGVVGCGVMGSGIAQVAAASGFNTVVREVSAELLDKGLKSIDKNLNRLAEKGTITEAVKGEIRGRLKGTTKIDALKNCDVIVEAIIEQLPAKRELLGALDAICPPSAIFASNTSSLTITEIATVTKRPQRFVGLHFFNPVPVMKLVEVVRTIATEPAVYEEMLAFGTKLGKTSVRAHDSTGFIVNRLLVPYLLDAIRALEEGVASIEDIDNSMKLGCGHPMGPLTLLDFVGLDTTYYISQIMFEEFKERRFAAPPLLKRMVLAGGDGRKSGLGVYVYLDPLDARSDAAVRVLILTGAGEKAFVAGADISELALQTPVNGKEFSLFGQGVFHLLETMGKPSICAINGFALGGGCELALSCTIRIASKTAKLGQPEVKLGILPGYGGSQPLAQLCGKGVAHELCLTGEMITAEEAQRIGLVNHIYEPAELIPAAEAMAKKIIANGPLAVKFTMEAIERGVEMAQEEGLFLEATLFGVACATEDMREGTKAFLEKRPPQFKGK